MISVLFWRCILIRCILGSVVVRLFMVCFWVWNFGLGVICFCLVLSMLCC